MEVVETIRNISERSFLAKLLLILKPTVRMSTIQWAETHRVMASTESSIVGRFDCSRTPAFEYLYNLCDNWFIHIIGCMKSSQIGASEMENNVIGKTMDLTPCNAAVFFPGTNLLKEYSRKRFQPFFRTCATLREKVNIGIPKPAHDFFSFIGGSLSLKTLGSIQSVLSSPIPFIILEEFAQVKAEVAKQGDPLGLVMGRQKSFFIGMKKVLAFSTPTFKDFCNMEKLFNKGLRLVFKAKCHACGELIELSGWTMDNVIQYYEYSDRYIDEAYGKYDPDTAHFACTACNAVWSFQQKTENIIAGKEYGFIDDCGDFSLGWHSMAGDKEVITRDEYNRRELEIDKFALRKKLKDNKTSLTYSLQYPEILSCFEATSDAQALATKKILAELAFQKGDETLLKDWFNNSKGLPYTSGVSAIEAEEMKTFRKNYPEHICPMEGLILTAGVDVQIDRFAIVIRAWGHNNNSWLVSWKEIHGNVLVQERDANGHFLGVWAQLTDILVKGTIPHASGKPMHIAAVSIDSGDSTELVYRWVLAMKELLDNRLTSTIVMATKGVRDLRFSDNEIYQEPAMFDLTNERSTRKSIAEQMGVPLYYIGAHRAHEEILRRVALNQNPDARSNMYYHNEQSYGQYEEQMTSCRKLIDPNSSYTKSVFKLIPGKRKEAMDAEKNALHAAYALQLRNYTYTHWKSLEDYYYG
jgi:phage terminase large subunit GpA-like protein